LLEGEQNRAEALALDLAAARGEVVSIKARLSGEASEPLKMMHAMAEEAEDKKQAETARERVEAPALNQNPAPRTWQTQAREDHFCFSEIRMASP
jgi:hypothetical protein